MCAELIDETGDGGDCDEELDRRDGADDLGRRQVAIGEQAGRGDGTPAAAARGVDEAAPCAERHEELPTRRRWGLI